MNIKYLRTWVVIAVKADGSAEPWFLGVGPDGDRWVDARLLGIGTEALLDMARDHPGCISLHPSGRCLVKVQAACEGPGPPKGAEQNLVALVREYWDGSKPVIF